MAGVPDKVLNWLYSVLTSEYTDVQRTYHDAAEALSHHPSLSPRTDIYTYENGSSALLLLLSGTLPVTFRGTTYGFPVAVWVPHAYPREAPLVYITPSQDMAVRPGQHISGEGRVYHPYLAQWAQHWDKSTLFDFLAVLRGVFAKEPPVRSKQQPQVSTTVQPIPPPVPPPPAEWWRATQPTSATSSGERPAPPPPKPPKSYERSGSTPQLQDRYSRPPPLPPQQSRQATQAHQLASQQHHQRDNYDPPPNWQPQPIQTVHTNQQIRYDRPLPALGPPVQTQSQQPGSYEYGSPVSPINPEEQRNPSRYAEPAPHQASAAPSQVQQYRSSAPQPQYIQPPVQHQQGQPLDHVSHNPPTYQFQGPQVIQQTTSIAVLPINFMDDSLEVTIPSQTSQAPLPVPPVPPNPEKDALLSALSASLISQINNTLSSHVSAITPLRAQQAALQTAYSRLQSELTELQHLDTALALNEKVLQGAMRDADRVMSDARSRQPPDVDDILVAPTMVSAQLYNLVAEEKGIAEALFVLGRALDKGRVGAEVFVKQTRSLAREQFLIKALIKKIATGLALDEYQVRG